MSADSGLSIVVEGQAPELRIFEYHAIFTPGSDQWPLSASAISIHKPEDLEQVSFTDSSGQVEVYISNCAAEDEYSEYLVYLRNNNIIEFQVTFFDEVRECSTMS